jgi:anti-anti-sigma factor
VRFDDEPRSCDQVGESLLFTVRARRSGDLAVLAIVGELDLDSQELLATTAQAVLEEPPPPARLEIDATGIEFVDSSGLATLLRIRERAGDADIPFGVSKSSLRFERVVSLAGLARYLSAAT